MDLSRRELLGLMAAGALAGCSGGDQSGGSGDGNTDGGGRSEGSSATSPVGSCASSFGDTMQRYDTGDRPMIATFSYPTGGEITFEQSDSVGHVTAVGYGRGEISALHDLTVSERGPTNTTADATEAYAFDDRFESGTVTTYGGRERPAAIRRTDDSSVTYIFRVEGPDGFYEFSVQTAVGEGEPCPDTYETITRRVAESFEPVA